MSKSTKSPRARKVSRPQKPYPKFPLTPHASGKWMKKIRGHIHYFGAWATRVDGNLQRAEGDGWEAALEEYNNVAADLHAGRTPRVNKDGLSVALLCNHFLDAKKKRMQAREMTTRSYTEYRATTDLIVSQLGNRTLVDDLAAPDFEALRATIARRAGPVRLGNEVQRVRCVFKYAYEAGLIDRPMRFGPEFVKPSAATMRKHRAKTPAKMFEAADLRKMVEGADVPLKAMVLLGLNAGFGNTDCAALPHSALNLDAGTFDFARPKTGIERRGALWPETVSAIRAALEVRPKPAGYEECGLVFLTSAGTAWLRVGEKSRSDYVSIQFKGLLKRLGLHRNRFGFYSLRHIFRTVADGSRDPVAIDLIMGHGDSSMGARYRERIDDARLKAVTDYVHGWLFPAGKAVQP